FARMGVKAVILTNAAGGINREYSQGCLVVVRDHINLQGVNPLAGPNDERFGPRFPDMTRAYDRAFSEFTVEEGKRLGIAIQEGDAEPFPFLNGEFAERTIVGARHVRETRAEALIVRPGERVYALEIDMVAHDDEAALRVFAIDSARRIREDHGFDAHAGKDANRKRDILHGIAFVEMNTALHSGHGDAIHRAEDELAGVADCGGARKIRNLRVGHLHRAAELVGERTETG